MILTSRLAGLAFDSRGSIVIETALVAPVLVLLGLGTFDVSQVVSRQNDLQSAAAEAEAIVQASPPTDTASRDAVRGIMEASIDPTSTDPNDTETVTEIYRCSTGAYQAVKPTCATGEKLSSYIKIELTDAYNPTWTSFGVGSTMNYRVVRMVQIS